MTLRIKVRSSDETRTALTTSKVDFYQLSPESSLLSLPRFRSLVFTVTCTTNRTTSPFPQCGPELSKSGAAKIWNSLCLGRKLIMSRNTNHHVLSAAPRSSSKENQDNQDNQVLTRSGYFTAVSPENNALSTSELHRLHYDFTIILPPRQDPDTQAPIPQSRAVRSYE